MKWYQYYEKSSGKQPDIEFEFKAKNKKEALDKLLDWGDYSPEKLRELKSS